MKSVGILGFGALALTLAGSPALSSEPVKPTYLLDMQIHDGDRLVGSPKLKIASGEPSTIEIGEGGGNHYNVTMTAMARPGQIVFVKSKIDVVAGGIHQALSPNMLVTLNKSSGIAFGTESATSKPIRVDFTLTKVG